MLRNVAGLTFGELVEKSGLGRGYVSELERGLVVPTVGTLARLADALDVTIADLVVGDTEREAIFDALRDNPALVADAREQLAKLLGKSDKGR